MIFLSEREDISNYSGFSIRYGKICYNGIDILTGDFKSLIGNFHIEDGVKYYKNQNLKELCNKILSGEINVNNYPGFEIRLGRVCYNRKDVLTDNKILFNNSLFYEKDEELWYYDKETEDYISWNVYKEKFLVSSKNIELPKDFEIITTFRTQDSEDWSNAKTAFEQSLLDLGVDWFVYIKFYINKNNKSVPLVCGKSGSLSVNNNGSYVSFSTDINDGPARRFLAENNFNWDKTRIAILKCSSEKQAYLVEQKYLKELNIFGS